MPRGEGFWLWLPWNCRMPLGLPAFSPSRFLVFSWVKSFCGNGTIRKFEYFKCSSWKVLKCFSCNVFLVVGLALAIVYFFRVCCFLSDTKFKHRLTCFRQDVRESSWNTNKLTQRKIYLNWKNVTHIFLNRFPKGKSLR